MRAIRVLGGIKFVPAEEFPDNPELGRPVFKDGILYIYTEVAGILSWYPLTQPRATYVHVQPNAVLTERVYHGLGTNDVIVMIQNDQGEYITADIKAVYIAENPVETRYGLDITFTEAESYRAIIFASSAAQWAAETVTQLEAEEGTSTARRAWTAQRVRQAITAVVDVPVELSTSSSVNIDFSARTAYEITLSGATTVTFSGLTDGLLDEALVRFKGLNSNTVVWPAGLIWMKADGSYTADASQIGFPFSVDDWVVFWSGAESTTVIAKLMR